MIPVIAGLQVAALIAATPCDNGDPCVVEGQNVCHAGCTAPPGGLLNWWSFDETSGPVAHDIAGQGLGAPVTGCSGQSIGSEEALGCYGAGSSAPSVLIGGPSGNALCFDGIDDFVAVPENLPDPKLNLRPGRDFTLDLSILPHNMSGLHTILDKRAISNGSPLGYALFLYDGHLGFQLATGLPANSMSCGWGPSYPCTNYLDSVALPSSGWSHVAVVLRSGTVEFYLNGVKSPTTFPARGGGTVNGASLQIGRRDPAFGANHFDGCLDDLEMFDHALSAAELSGIAAGKCKTFCNEGSLCTSSGCLPADDALSEATCTCGLLSLECADGGCAGTSFCSNSCAVCYAGSNPISMALCGGPGGTPAIDCCCKLETTIPSAYAAGAASSPTVVTLNGLTQNSGSSIVLEGYDNLNQAWIYLGATWASTIPACSGLYPWSISASISRGTTLWPQGGVLRVHALSNGHLGQAVAFNDVSLNPTPFALPPCAVDHCWEGWSNLISECTTYVDPAAQQLDPVLTIVDEEPGPAPPVYLSYKATPGYPNLDPLQYYALIGAGPGQPRSTFNGWLAANGFTFTDLHTSCLDATPPSAGAVYYNRVDIGIGRKMNCRTVHATDGGVCDGVSCPMGAPYDPSTQPVGVACAVVNTGASFYTFGAGAGVSEHDALILMLASQPAAAAVTMEYVLGEPGEFCCAPPPSLSPPSDPVRFYVYNFVFPLGPNNPYTSPVVSYNSDEIMTEVELDNQHAKPVPGICLSCHYGGYNPSNHRVDSPPATFLPFDTCGYGFATWEPSCTLEAQLEDFRLLNEKVMETNPSPGIQDLIDGWYGGSSGVHSPGKVANDGYVPAGWAGHEELYTHVVKPYCRTCHAAISPVPSNFAVSYASFATFAPTIKSFVCGAYLMPHAERTAALFWQSDARGYLVDWLISTGLSNATSCGP